MKFLTAAVMAMTIITPLSSRGDLGFHQSNWYSCSSLKSISSTPIWDHAKYQPSQEQIKYAAQAFKSNQIIKPKTKKYKSIEVSYTENGTGLQCESAKEVIKIDKQYPVTSTYVPVGVKDGALVSISIGLQQETTWDKPGSIISLSGLINLNSPEGFKYTEEESPVKISGDIYEPANNKTFAIGYSKAMVTDPVLLGLHFGRSRSMQVCTWGETHNGLSYGLDNLVTSVNCQTQEKGGNHVKKSSDNYLYLHDYALFVTGPGSRLRSDKEGSYTLSRDNYRIKVVD